MSAERNAGRPVSPNKGPRNRGAPFTREENLNLIAFIDETDTFRFTRGNKLWETIARLRVFQGRPAVSLRNRWRRLEGDSELRDYYNLPGRIPRAIEESRLQRKADTEAGRLITFSEEHVKIRGGVNWTPRLNWRNPGPRQRRSGI